MQAETEAGRGNVEKALGLFKEALSLAESTSEKMIAHLSMGKYYVGMDREKAVEHTEIALELQESHGVDDMHSISSRALILNQLSFLHGRKDPQRVIAVLEKLESDYRALYEMDNASHFRSLGSTWLRLSRVLADEGDIYRAGKYCQQVIELCKSFEETHEYEVRQLRADAFYELGMIRQDEDKYDEARSFLHKSLYNFEKLYEREPDDYRWMLASALNNIAVVNRLMGYLPESKKYYLRSIELYRTLIKQRPENYLPYYAATLNSLANVYADSWAPEDDMFSGDRGFLPGLGAFGGSVVEPVEDERGEEDMRRAELYYKEALEVYEALAKQYPDMYTHYVATTKHNLGVLYDEFKLFDRAEEEYNKALDIRYKLASIEPEAFDLDVCSTQLNLVTMYQTQLEQSLDLSFRDKCVALLEDTQNRLEKYNLSDLPESVSNMAGDVEYFTLYFANFNEADLHARHTAVQAELIEEEAMSTMDLDKRFAGFRKILDLYDEKLARFPNHDGLSLDRESFIMDAVVSGLKAHRPELIRSFTEERKDNLRDGHFESALRFLLLCYDAEVEEATRVLDEIRNLDSGHGGTYRELLEEVTGRAMLSWQWD